jgi:hypothetical protein
MLFREIIAVYPENEMKLINTLCEQNAVTEWYILLPLGFKGLI